MEPKSPVSGAGREGSTSIELGLGIGGAHGGGGVKSGSIKEGISGFTAAQLHELQQQSLVLNYIVEGLPVPHHLVVPIWKSVAKSFGSANGGIYNQFPSFIGFSPQGLDYRSMTDPEPGRCRRTDGKKWRCSKNVVPDQKYCERHMHRGRNRAKKFTEASVTAPESNSVLSSNCTRTNTESCESTKTESKEPAPVTVKLELATPSSENSSHTLVTKASTTITTANGKHESHNDVSKKDSALTTTTSIDDGSCEGQNDVVVQKDAASTMVTITGGSGEICGSDDKLAVKKDSAATITTPSSTGSHANVKVEIEAAATTPSSYIGGDIFGSHKDVVIKASAATTASIGDIYGSGSNIVMKDSTASCSVSAAAEINCNRRSNNDFDDIKHAEYDQSNTGINSKWRIGPLVAPGFGLSPNSVLQVVGGGHPQPNPDADVAETELTRCRRTDGKKWRCSKEVIPDEKYCGRHMHRGAKKVAVGVPALQSVTIAAAPPPSSGGVHLDPPLAIPKLATNPNTELSISIATTNTSSQQGIDEEDSPSSSDATTITDENGSIAHLLVLSP